VERRKFIFDSNKQKSTSPQNGSNSSQTTTTATLTPSVNTVNNKAVIKKNNEAQAVKSQLGSIRKEITDANRSILNIQTQLNHKRPRRTECWNCGKSGHFASECERTPLNNNKRQRTFSNRTCRPNHNDRPFIPRQNRPFTPRQNKSKNMNRGNK